MKIFKIKEATFLADNRKCEFTFVHEYEKDDEPFFINVEDDEYEEIKGISGDFRMS